MSVGNDVQSLGLDNDGWGVIEQGGCSDDPQRTRSLTFYPTSLAVRVAALVTSFFAALVVPFLGLYAAYKLTDRVAPTTIRHAVDLSNPTIEGSEIPKGIDRLRRGEQLTGVVMQKYAEYLEEILKYENFNFIVEAGLCANNNNSAARALNAIVNAVNAAVEDQRTWVEGELVFIPLVLKGMLEDHIVLLTFDPRKGQFEYFDSQGKVCAEEGRSIRGLGMTPQQLVEKVKDARFRAGERSEFPVISNKTRFQGRLDSTNCGVYVSRFMRERSKEYAQVESDEAFQYVCDAMRRVDPREERRAMIEALLQLAEQNLQDAEANRNALSAKVAGNDTNGQQ